MFTADGIPLSQVTSFKYLGRIITLVDDACPAVDSNLRKARRKWAQLTGVMGREGVDARTSVQIYLVVVQLVILYVSETWLITPRIGRVLGIFHHRVDSRLTGRQPRQGRDGVWLYPPL